MALFSKLLKKDNVNEDEILSMVNEGHEQGVLEASEAEMISNIFAFGDKEAQDIMTHREHILGIEGGETLDKAIDFMLGSKNTRFPIFEDNIDNIVGIVHFKDAVKLSQRQENGGKSLLELEGLIMEARFIPETRKVDSLFRTMQQNKIHLVIVVDEYGQTAGIVTMEDILEEIVGNIQDEHDEDEEPIRKQGDDTFVISGLATLDEVGEALNISFPDEGYETLNGFMTDRLKHVPKSGEDFETEFEGYRFRIALVKGRVVRSVRCTKVNE